MAHWWKEFGDNDVLGWATTLAYFVVAILCFRAARAIRRQRAAQMPPALPSDSARPADWTIIGVGVLLLGINKQLDLQILARDTGLALVKAAGFDENRRWVGRLFVLVLSVAVLSVLARSARHLRAARRGHTLTLIGLTLLACFLIVRAAGYLPFLSGFNVRYKDVLHVVLELGGLAFVGVSAWRAPRSRPTSAGRPPPQFEHQ